MIQPKVTVYIPSKNYGRFLFDAIESVMRQTMENWELLLIDENSTDNTREIIQRYEGDERVRLFSTAGIGLHGVGNLALKEARGEYIIRLDGDDIFDENILLVLSNYLDIHPDIALVFPDFYLMDEFGDIFAHERRQKLYQANHLFDNPPNGACFLARKEVLLELGGYREDLDAQDGFYIWLKLIGAHKCDNVNLPLYYYRRHEDNLTNKSQRILAARREIKRESIASELDKFRPFTAIIPCRRNYDFCVDLWKRRFNGKLLVEHAIETCLTSTILDRIVLACDNPESEEILKNFRDPRLSFYLRDKRETIRSERVVTTLGKIASKVDPEGTGISAIAYVQAPFVTIGTIEEALFTLIMNEADSAVGVEEITRPLYKRSSFGLRAVNPPIGISSDFHTVYAEARSLLVTKNRNMKTGSLIGSRVVNFLVSAEESYLITSEQGFQIASILSMQRDVFGK